MPTVIGLNQVPPNTPRPTFHDYYGQLYGTAGRQLTDAVLAYLTSGAYQNNQQKYPNPSYGQSSLPTLNPDVTLQQASPPLNPLAPPPNPQAVSRQFAQPAQPPIFPPTQPKISLQDIQVAQVMQKIREAQQAQQIAPYELAYKKAQTQDLLARAQTYTPEFQANTLRQLQGLPPIGSQGTEPSADSGFTQGLNKLSQLSDESNPDQASMDSATRRIRLILQLLQEQ